MKNRSLLLVAASFVVALTVAIYILNSGSAPLPKTANMPTTDPASALPPHPSAPLPALPGERTAPPSLGRDGEFTSAPARPDGALTGVPSPLPALAPGTAAKAWVQAGEKTTEVLQPNQSGEFPRVYITPGQEVGVRLGFPEKEPGTRLFAAVEDGGKFADGKPAVALTLDERRETAFRFIADTAPGQYRISVRLGPDVKVVTLWVAAAPRVAGVR